MLLIVLTFFLQAIVLTINYFAAHRPDGNALMAAIALQMGLLLVWNRGFRKVHCEVDSKELLSLLHDQNAHRLPILENIQELLLKSWDISISHIRREANVPADWLAKFGANNYALDVLVFEDPPPEAGILVLRDLVRAS